MSILLVCYYYSGLDGFSLLFKIFTVDDLSGQVKKKVVLDLNFFRVIRKTKLASKVATSRG